MIEQSKRKVLIRKTNYFLKDEQEYKSFNKQFKLTQRLQIVDVQLQCLGYGVFNAKKLKQRFFNYIKEMSEMGQKSKIKSLKITFNGFKLDVSERKFKQKTEQKTELISMAQYVCKLQSNLVNLEIRTANLEGTTLEDFCTLLNLAKQMGQQNFQQFTLQCANWTFLYGRQPTFHELEVIFTELISLASDIPIILNRKFRLQMSGWYSTEEQAKQFLGFEPKERKQEQKYKQYKLYSDKSFEYELNNFFNRMKLLITSLIQVMTNLQDLEIDMRNMNSIMRMGQLKKQVENLSKSNRVERSLISKRQQSRIYNRKDDQKEFRFNFTV